VLQFLSIAIFFKMLFVSCPFLKDNLIRIDGCASAYEIKGNILAAWVRLIFGHLWYSVMFNAKIERFVGY
jgi:hypothetical protein